MLLIGNWKMHGSRQQLNSFLARLGPVAKGIRPVLCLPFLYLENTVLPEGYALGAQDCSAYAQGAFTGQVSASMLKDVGCQFVLVGHPERAYCESEGEVQQKALQAQMNGLIPVICVGQDFSSLSKRIPPQAPFMVAYEPAIGAKTPPEEVEEVLPILRSFLPPLIPVLYGGAVNPQTVRPLLGKFEGFLVGRASLELALWEGLMTLIASSS